MSFFVIISLKHCSSFKGHKAPIRLYSMSIPAAQGNYKQNFAITVEGNELILGQKGSCWIPHTSGKIPNESRPDEGQTVSLELMNSDGYFMMQKNYGFVLKKRNQSKEFGMLQDFKHWHSFTGSSEPLGLV